MPVQRWARKQIRVCILALPFSNCLGFGPGIPWKVLLVTLPHRVAFARLTAPCPAAANSIWLCPPRGCPSTKGNTLLEPDREAVLSQGGPVHSQGVTDSGIRRPPPLRQCGTPNCKVPFLPQHSPWDTAEARIQLSLQLCVAPALPAPLRDPRLYLQKLTERKFSHTSNASF